MLFYAIQTNQGSRSINEDSVAVCENDGHYCFILCDGLGGHGMGDVASQLVTESFKDLFSTAADVYLFLPAAFEKSQELLLLKQAELNAQQKMKTTAAALVTDGEHVYIGHVGDSRVYVFRHNKVKTRTLDHSVPQMLVLTKEIKKSEIRNHPDRSLILKVMGTEWNGMQYELMEPIRLKKCQAFLLCSDGFWELIDEKKMCELLKRSDNVQTWLSEMEKVVRKNGEGRNMDNYSAIAVWNTK